MASITAFGASARLAGLATFVVTIELFRWVPRCASTAWWRRRGRWGWRRGCRWCRWRHRSVCDDDVSTAVPHLICLLAVPPPRKNVLTRLVWHVHLIHDAEFV